jgi:hypothetical protein
MIGTTFHPFAYVSFVLVGLFCYIVIRSKTDLQGLVQSINAFGDQFWAIIIISLGCIMLLLSKQYSIESSISTTIVGAGIGILTKKNDGKKPDDNHPQQ